MARWADPVDSSEGRFAGHQGIQHGEQPVEDMGKHGEKSWEKSGDPWNKYMKTRRNIMGKSGDHWKSGKNTYGTHRIFVLVIRSDRWIPT